MLTESVRWSSPCARSFGALGEVSTALVSLKLSSLQGSTIRYSSQPRNSHLTTAKTKCDRSRTMATAAKKPNVAFDILASHHGADFAASYYRDKVVQRPLYLKPTPKDESTPSEPTAREVRQKAREAVNLRKRKSPGKPRPLSAKQKRALQIYAIPKEQQKYEIYVPLHRLWCGYMREILGLEKPDNGYGRFIEAKGAGPLLSSADYHGALVEVGRSRCVSRVGVKGIVVRDTKSTFEIVTIKNQIKGESLVKI